MKVAGEYTFDAPQEIVWAALQDPSVLASVLPGCEELVQTGEDSYEGALNLKVGPVQGKFQGQIQLQDIRPPDGYRMLVDGKGAPGFVKASGELQLQGQGEKTLMTYEGDAQVGGRIASVGQRLMDSSAKAIIKQSLEALNELLKAQVAAAAISGDGETAESSTPQVKAPTQAQFAAGVAKEVASDLIPRQYRPVLIGLLIVLIIVALILVLG